MIPATIVCESLADEQRTSVYGFREVLHPGSSGCLCDDTNARVGGLSEAIPRVRYMSLPIVPF